jgi:ATP-dependent Lon protease
MNLSVQEKYEILKTSDLQKRALMCLKQMNIELQRLSLKNEVQSKVRSDLDQQQREYFLHQQLKTIQEELGGVSYDEEINEMRIKATNKKWSKEIKIILKRNYQNCKE